MPANPGKHKTDLGHVSLSGPAMLGKIEIVVGVLAALVAVDARLVAETVDEKDRHKGGAGAPKGNPCHEKAIAGVVGGV